MVISQNVLLINKCFLHTGDAGVLGVPGKTGSDDTGVLHVSGEICIDDAGLLRVHGGSMFTSEWCFPYTR